MTYNIDWGVHAVLKLASMPDVQTVLDVGSGDGEQARLLRDQGFDVTSIDMDKSADICGDFMEEDIETQFDAVYCSHILEHQRNVGAFLERLAGTVKENGWIFVIVPIHPPERLVAGHLSVWSPWLLLYNLILAGVDCRKACFISTFELSLCVRKSTSVIPSLMQHSAIGDDGADVFQSIREYFPVEPQQFAELAGCVNHDWGDLYPRLPMPVEVVCKNEPKVIRDGYNHLR